jgi:hypothetical protein
LARILLLSNTLILAVFPEYLPQNTADFSDGAVGLNGLDKARHEVLFPFDCLAKGLALLNNRHGTFAFFSLSNIATNDYLGFNSPI